VVSVLVVMAFMLGVSVILMQVVHVVSVLHRLMAAAFPVDVVGVLMGAVLLCGGHRISLTCRCR